MNDTLREYLSYGQLIVPILKIKKNIQPEEVNWGDRDQYFLYYPSPCKKADTLVVYIHGGGWNAGSPKDFYFIGQKIALEGFDCMMLGYRKASKYHYPEISEDIFEGYVKLREHLKRRDASILRPLLWGRLQEHIWGHFFALTEKDRHSIIYKQMNLMDSFLLQGHYVSIIFRLVPVTS